MTIGETISNFVGTNWLFFVVVLGIVAYLLILGIRKNLKSKKAKKAVNELGELPVMGTEAELKFPPIQEKEEEFSSLFGDTNLTKKDEGFDIAKEVIKMGELMSTDSTKLDKNMEDEFERLRKQLFETNERTEEIKKYGLELSALYTKYQRRRMNLTVIMDGLNQMIENKYDREETDLR